MPQTKLFVQDFTAMPVSEQTPIPTDPDREPVLILVIGSEKGIDKIVRSLHLYRFDEIQEWSRLLPAQTPGKLMRSLLRYVLPD